MTLPSSGQLAMSQIATEVYGSVGTNRSLRSMSSYAGFSTPDLISDFYGWSNVYTITLSYGSITEDAVGPQYYQYRTVNHAGQTSATNISLAIGYSNLWARGSGAYTYLQWSANSTSSWTTLASRIAGQSSTSGTVNITNILYTTVIRLRIFVNVGGTCNINSITGSVYSGDPANFTNISSSWVVAYNNT